MVIIFIIIGGLIGWLLVQAGDTLIRFSHRPPKKREMPGVQIGVSILFAALLAFLWLQFGLSWQMGFLAISCAFFLLIAVIDLKYRLVLNMMTYPAIVGILIVRLWLEPENMLSVILGGLFAFSIFYVTARLRPGDLGMGDVKLAALIGFFFGFPGVLYALLIGGGTGAVVAIMLLLQKHGMKHSLPYAPFLCAGAVMVLLYL